MKYFQVDFLNQNRKFFYQFLKLKEIQFENNFLVIFIPFILLLSPWFRSSSYWGMTENFAFFFLIPSVSALMAWLFLNENLYFIDIIGFLIASIGVYIATRPEK